MTIKSLLTTVFSIYSSFYLNLAVAEIFGEENEPTPESLDATFTSADAERVAAGFSSEVIEVKSADPVKNLSNAADLIFTGKVLDQSYFYDAAHSPSTHTTFSITNVLKGSYPSAELTLIQPGGPSKSGDTALMVSTTRHFSVGEEELLFVILDPDNVAEPNRITIESRFRIYENHIYNEDGYGVIMEPSGKLTLSYDRHPSKHFNLIDMGSHSLFKRHSVDDNRDSGSGEESLGSVRSASNRKSYTDSMDLNTFSAIIGK